VPNINKHLHIVIAIVIFVSLLPAIIEVLRSRRKPEQKNEPVSDVVPEQE
jgi:hypothetical protein